MKTRIKAIALLLAVILTFSGVLGGSAVIPTEDISLSTTPTEATAPTTSSTTEPTTEPTTVPTTTEPETQPSEETTTAPATEPAEPPTILTEPYSSTNITIGPEVEGISAKKAFVYDCEARSFLYMKSEADAKIYPASITKLMNAYVALKYLNPNDILTMTAEILSIVPSDTSKAYIYSGDRFTVENVLKATLLPSGSDAAHLLAVSAGRVIANNPYLSAQRAEDAFVAEMNRQAASMGLVNTHFVNCDGYTNYYHYTCMADLVTIATACLDTPLIRDTVRCTFATLYYVDGRSRTIGSTLSLLQPSSIYYREEARGLKTGTTAAAGACLLSAFWSNDRYILVGVFQCSDNSVRCSNAITLFETFADTTPPVTEPDPTDPTTVPPTETTTEPTTEPTVPTETAPADEDVSVGTPIAGVTAQNAFVYHTGSGSCSYVKGKLDDRLYPASITKLFTAYVALKYLDPAQSVTVGEIIQNLPAGAFKAWLSTGDVLTVQDLLAGTLLPSGADTAWVLAVEAGRVIAGNPSLGETEAMAVFVAEMNAQAASAGMVNTHFVNPEGCHNADHYSCMSDLITMATLCLDNAAIRRITGLSSYTAQITLPSADGEATVRSQTWTNTNYLLSPSSGYYRDTAIGLKTGYTTTAGRCLLSAFEVNGEIVIIGVFGCPDPNNTAVTQFENTCTIYDSLFSSP